MESLKKIISLNQAAKMSGYTQDYLGYLIRSGEMKGIKKGRSWFTTEEEVNNYIFKKKVRSGKFAVRGFFSATRSKKIVITTLVLFFVIFLFWTNFIIKKSKIAEVQFTLSSQQESGDIFN